MIQAQSDSCARPAQPRRAFLCEVGMRRTMTRRKPGWNDVFGPFAPRLARFDRGIARTRTMAPKMLILGLRI